MLAKRSDGYYAKVSKLPDGRIVRYPGEDKSELAMLSGGVVLTFPNQQALEAAGCTLLPPELEHASLYDVLVNEEGNERIVLAAQGVGEHRALLLTNRFNDNAATESWYTVAELRKKCFTLKPWNDQRVMLTKEQIKEKLGFDFVIIE